MTEVTTIYYVDGGVGAFITTDANITFADDLFIIRAPKRNIFVPVHNISRVIVEVHEDDDASDTL